MVEVVETVEIEGLFRLIWDKSSIVCELLSHESLFSYRQFEIWHQLGTVEIDDQIAVTNYLIKNLPIIDPKRVIVIFLEFSFDTI